MSLKRLRQDKLTLSEFLVGVMYYIQLAYSVKTFPPSDDPAWELFVYYLANEPELGISISTNFNLQPFLDDATMLDPETNRIYVDPRDAQKITLDNRFQRFAQRMYEIALETKGLIEFS